MAFDRRARSMSWGIIDSRLGSSNARKTLVSAASTSSGVTLTLPASVSANAVPSASAVRSWVPIKRRRRFTRSASTPPQSWNTIIGMPWARPR